MVGTHWAYAGGEANTCALDPAAGEAGSRISTAYTARDAMKIVDALDDDGMLRYWGRTLPFTRLDVAKTVVGAKVSPTGTSYGTILGATVAAMFPERMDKVVLDGVVNPHEWYYGLNSEWAMDADPSLDAIFQTCLNSGDSCPFSGGNQTVESLRDEFFSVMEEAKLRPILVGSAVIDRTAIAAAVRPQLNDPTTWPLLTVWLNDLFTRNETGIALGYLQLLGVETDGTGKDAGDAGDDSATGIQCADAGFRTDDLEVFQPAIDKITNASRTTGLVLIKVQMKCAQWKIKPKERYEGGFNNIKTKNPILVFTHSLDGSTSHLSAENITASFDGSVLLKSNGYGHCWRAQPSVCTAKAMQKYFDQGELPDPDTVCDVDVTPFKNVTDVMVSWNQLLPEIGFESE
ncbi:Tripeptidyl aminopeptidase [Colletotrichum viniferum]|nr:Tripeptidyl aminopeptidase [Colletotrichum viniferum]